jgi:hypothetical protein
MSHDPRAAFDAIAAALGGPPMVVSAQMFGMPCLKHAGKAFAGLHGDAMAFKLGPPAHAAALALPGAHLFDPSGRGRPMKQWVAVPAAASAHWPALAREALHYLTASL